MLAVPLNESATAASLRERIERGKLAIHVAEVRKLLFPPDEEPA